MCSDFSLNGFSRHIILCTQCYLRRGTCLNAMKRFYFIFLPVVLVFLYSIPILYCVPNVICIGEPV